MVEVGGLLAGDGGDSAEVHQQGAFGVEQHDLLVWQAEGESERGGGRLAHRAAQGDVSLLVGADILPVSSSGAGGGDDGVAAVLLECFEYVSGVNHV